MKKKTLLFVLLGILTACILTASIFSVLHGLVAREKEQAYFDIYREKAKVYIQSDPEMIGAYGNAITVEFDGMVTYKEIGKKTLLDILDDAFLHRVPDTPEAFAEKIEYITFTVEVNGDLYKITFEKNGADELVVTKLAKAEN